MTQTHRIIIMVGQVFTLAGFIMSVVCGFRGLRAVPSVAACAAVLTIGYLCQRIPMWYHTYRERGPKTLVTFPLFQFFVWVLFSSVMYLVGIGVAKVFT
jgi:hypothetical protein